MFDGGGSASHVVVLPRSTARAWARKPKTAGKVPQVVGARNRSLLRGKIDLLSDRDLKAPLTLLGFHTQDRVGATACFNQNTIKDLPIFANNSSGGRRNCFTRRRRTLAKYDNMRQGVNDELVGGSIQLTYLTGGGLLK
eukprot:2450343-Heterocapsa_arctica.AAC.1